MENTSKKFWIIILAIPITLIGMFVAYLIVTYANTAIRDNVESPISTAPDYVTESDAKGGVYMNEGLAPTITSSNQNIIKIANITMSADDMDATLTSIQALKTTYGATTTNLQDSGKGSERYITLTIKVEESKFEILYNKIKELPGEFTYSAISSTDVSETVQDLETRLANLKKLETQYNTILKSAKTVTEILAVQKELASTRTEIESIQTQLKNLDNQTSYSYITVYMTQSSVGSQLSDDKWQPIGILKDAGRTLVGFAKFLGTGLIYVLVFSPVIAAVVIPVVIIQKRAKK